MTGTSSRFALALLGLTAAAGCGAAAHPAARASAAPWLRPAAAPPGWRTLAIASGATLSYPPGWRPAAGDRGSATAILWTRSGALTGYLNITPRQGRETISRWAAFRLAHNADEGDRAVHGLGAYASLRFRSGRGSCVRDRYVTKTGARYIELACLVTGRHASTVIVGAAPPRSWPQMAPQIERAISAFTT